MSPPIWGSRAMSSCLSAAIAMILPSLMILCLRSALAIIQEHQPARITTVGGGCSVSMAPFSYLLQHGEVVMDRSVLDDFLVLNPEHTQTVGSP